MAFIAILLVCPYNKNNDEGISENSSNDIVVSTNTSTEQLIKNEELETSFLTISKIKDISNKNEIASKAICSRKFLACFSMSFCTSCNIFII
jgi:hypothetical protein